MIHPDSLSSLSRIQQSLPESGFTGTSVLVVGDLMLDRYVIGEAHRISPEAPVPIVEVSKEKITAGGAGNVALNLAGLRVRTLVAGVVGNDITGTILTDVLRKANIETSGILSDESRPTTCKTRIMSMSHQLVRFDVESVAPLDVPATRKLQGRIKTILDRGIDAVILSDYAKGVLTPAVTEYAIHECARKQIPVFIDPKRVDYGIYAHATCLTPNLKEFQAAASFMAIEDHGLSTTAQILREKLHCPMMLVTRGSQGMTLVTADQSHDFPALAEEIFDVSGAGDTVIATLTAAYAAHLDLVTAVELANFAASIVVKKVGTVPIVWEELKPPASTLLRSKVAPPRSLA